MARVSITPQMHGISVSFCHNHCGLRMLFGFRVGVQAAEQRRDLDILPPHFYTPLIQEGIQLVFAQGEIMSVSEWICAKVKIQAFEYAVDKESYYNNQTRS